MSDYKNGEKSRNNRRPADDRSKSESTQVKRVKLRFDVNAISESAAAQSERANDEASAAKEDGFTPTVLFEDNHLLVVIKPQNVPTQGDSSGDPDLLSLLKSYLIKKYNKPGDAYLGLLHRLDRPTGGVMVFAKTSKAAARLSEQIRSGEFEKVYAAVTVGRPNRVGTVEHYLIKDEANNVVTLAPSTLEGVKRALSEIKVVDERDGLSLVSVKLLTGRTHQARVQLKALGSPIVGDSKYGGDKYRPANHLALWAYRLEFSHPISGDMMTFLSEPPQEFPWTQFDTGSIVDFARPQSDR